MFVSLSFPSHRCVAVRGSTAQHLHQLADNCGAAHIFRAGRCFTERFLIAVSKMFADAAPDVRWVITSNTCSLQVFSCLSFLSVALNKQYFPLQASRTNDPQGTGPPEGLSQPLDKDCPRKGSTSPGQDLESQKLKLEIIPSICMRWCMFYR